MSLLFNLMNYNYNQCIPLRKRNVNRRKFSQSHWITKGILKECIKHKYTIKRVDTVPKRELSHKISNLPKWT